MTQVPKNQEVSRQGGCGRDCGTERIPGVFRSMYPKQQKGDSPVSAGNDAGRAIEFGSEYYRDRVVRSNYTGLTVGDGYILEHLA